MSLPTLASPCPRCAGSGQIHRVDGAALRRVREAVGWSMGRLARLGQVSVPYLSDVERGRRNVSERIVTLYLAMVKMAASGAAAGAAQLTQEVPDRV